MATTQAGCPACSPGGAGQKTEPAQGKMSYIAEEVTGPYEPGLIQPPVKKVYPPGAPPRYLPQPTDSTSGDMLTMGPIGPWAAGHMDWSPLAGTTGVRPVVDRYSITKYGTQQWRKNNAAMLDAPCMTKGKVLEAEMYKYIEKTLENIDQKMETSNNRLDDRIKELEYWFNEVLKEQKAMSKEISTLEEYRVKLKGASRILMLPESISKECLEIRTHRYGPDLVRDDAEQELIKEVAIVGEIRRVFNETLDKVNEQLTNNKAAKAAIELDWDNKMVALKEDRRNRELDENSTILDRHPGVVRCTENSVSLEYWRHWCQESIRNCREVRQKSENLRADLMTAIVKGSQDMKNQSDRTNAALEETVSVTEELCAKLEEYLRETLQKIADVETLMDTLMEKQRVLDEKIKLSHTRLHSRNYKRMNAENCRDEAHFALMDEAKTVEESNAAFREKLREAQNLRAELMKFRGDLEKDIASKRKALYIDRDRFREIRAHMPTPEEFAAASQ